MLIYFFFTPRNYNMTNTFRYALLMCIKLRNKYAPLISAGCLSTPLIAGFLQLLTLSIIGFHGAFARAVYPLQEDYDDYLPFVMQMYALSSFIR